MQPKEFTCISLIHEIRFCDLRYPQEHEISTTLPSLCPVGFQNPNAVQPAGVFNETDSVLHDRVADSFRALAAPITSGALCIIV